MSIKCQYCEGTHETAAEVRSCMESNKGVTIQVASEVKTTNRGSKLLPPSNTVRIVCRMFKCDTDTRMPREEARQRGIKGDPWFCEDHKGTKTAHQAMEAIGEAVVKSNAQEGQQDRLRTVLAGEKKDTLLDLSAQCGVPFSKKTLKDDIIESLVRGYFSEDTDTVKFVDEFCRATV